MTGFLAARNAPLSSVKAVVLTHYHPDHMGNAERLRTQAGAVVLVHPAGCRGPVIARPQSDEDSAARGVRHPACALALFEGCSYTLAGAARGRLETGSLAAEFGQHVADLRPVAVGGALLGERHLPLPINDECGRVSDLVLRAPPQPVGGREGIFGVEQEVEVGGVVLPLHELA